MKTKEEILEEIERLQYLIVRRAEELLNPDDQQHKEVLSENIFRGINKLRALEWVIAAKPEIKI